MTWPLRLLLSPLMLLMHGVLVVCFIAACIGSVWQWIRGKS